MDDEIGNEENSYREKVMSAVGSRVPNRVIPISFPPKTFKRFNAWALDNASNCYWLAIDKLIDSYESKLDYKTDVRLLSDRDDFLLMEVERLSAELDALKNDGSKPREKRTFGTKVNEDVK
jgi:hypothetical protein